MALAILGDIHGEYQILERCDDQLVDQSDIVAGIQVGDFGWYPSTMNEFRGLDLKKPWYWIDGNHEYFPILRDIKTVTEVANNLFYVPRGTVLELDGKTIGFIGGAYSVDKQYRVKNGLSWYDDENITDADIAKFDGIDRVDMLITHVPPQFMIQRYCDPRALLEYDLPTWWVDVNAVKIETLWERLGEPELYCGHMHIHAIDTTTKCRIMDINEMIIV